MMIDKEDDLVTFFAKFVTYDQICAIKRGIELLKDVDASIVTRELLSESILAIIKHSNSRTTALY
jgi:hypothetical protein